jgi:protein-S-isoprenylcysteine O-methyltransferase Ste14
MQKWKSYILSCIWGPCLIAQIVFFFVFGWSNDAGMSAVRYAGYGIWVISAVLGWMPIFVLKKQGGVAQGKSYVHTTTLVTTGLYSIVRHPQYTAGILFSLALVLVSQTWLILALGLVVMVLLYIDIMITDKFEIEKFGEEYKRYMKEVPRTNFVLGIIRRLTRNQ